MSHTADSLDLIVEVSCCQLFPEVIWLGWQGQIDAAVWQQDAVVHSQTEGDGCTCLKYLAPSVFRVAIGKWRIVSYDERQVTFSYR